MHEETAMRLFFCLAGLLFLTGCGTWFGYCDGQRISGQPELSCVSGCMSNRTDRCGYDEIVVNSTQKALITQELARAQLEAAKIQACYDAGESWNETYDIQRDYNISCQQIAYINDHLIDNYVGKDAGYISTTYSGFFSHYETTASMTQWVNERVLATGRLVREVRYHKDCEGNVTIERADMSVPEGCVRTEDGYYCDWQPRYAVTEYTTADLVMYYVDHCIGQPQVER